MTAPYRITDAELADMKTTVNAMRETIYAIALQQGWSFRSVPEWVALFAGAEVDDALPAVRRTFLLLEER